MSSNQPVLYERKEDIAWIRFNRPEARNAMNRDLLALLSQILDEVRADDAVKAVIFTGTGTEAFSAGADIRYLNQASPLEVRTFAQLAVSVNHTIETMGKVAIAAINGVALGGGLELAEACALRVAVPEAKLGHPEVQIGAIAGFGGTTRLPKIDWKRACRGSSPHGENHHRGRGAANGSCHKDRAGG